VGVSFQGNQSSGNRSTRRRLGSFFWPLFLLLATPFAVLVLPGCAEVKVNNKKVAIKESESRGKGLPSRVWQALKPTHRPSSSGYSFFGVHK